MSVDTQTLDIDAVDRYLSEHLDGYAGPLEVTKFQGGQSNPTFLLKTPARNYVLRRKPPGVLLKSARCRSGQRRNGRWRFRRHAPSSVRMTYPAMRHRACHGRGRCRRRSRIRRHAAGRCFPSTDFRGF